MKINQQKKMEDFKPYPYDDIKTFVQDVQRAMNDYRDDLESFHYTTDKLMENILIGLGYEEGVKAIRSRKRKYA